MQNFAYHLIVSIEIILLELLFYIDFPTKFVKFILYLFYILYKILKKFDSFELIK